MTDFGMTNMTRDSEIVLPLFDRDEAFSLAHRWVRPPGIRLEKKGLCYDDPTNGTEWVKNPSIKLLAHFVGLAAESPEAILRFARRWGSLGLCQHRAGGSPLLVRGHPPDPALGGEACRLLLAEPLEAWRYYARLLHSLLTRAIALRKRRVLRLRTQRAHDEVRLFLRDCHWVTRYFGCLHPVLIVEGCRFDVKLGGSFLTTGLPAALTSQLLFTLAGSAGLATCANCGKLFAPRRRPAAGQKAYCPNCGIRAAWREAQQRRRERAAGTPKA
jgi:predicted RNA-binding Zn-ribbon protein involved in translation (DUF1610 family)